MSPFPHVGTSGWTYDDWSGPFYPPGVKGVQRLEYYAQRFDAVEINATFYRTPSEKVIDSWNRRLPPDFHLVVKGPRRVTHFKKLIDFEEPLQLFLDRVLVLKTLKVVLWQLPPSLHRDLDRLKAFLEALPRDVRHAVEFRHPSWWNQETAALLAEDEACFVILSHPRLPAEIIPTTDFLYLRFHGLGRRLYQYDYSFEELRTWAEGLAPHLAGRDLYAFFNNDFAAHAPKNAALFKELLAGLASKTTTWPASRLP